MRTRMGGSAWPPSTSHAIGLRIDLARTLVHAATTRSAVDPLGRPLGGSEYPPLDRQEQSGKTIRAFCAANDVNQNTLLSPTELLQRLATIVPASWEVTLVRKKLE